MAIPVPPNKPAWRPRSPWTGHDTSPSGSGERADRVPQLAQADRLACFPTQRRGVPGSLGSRASPRSCEKRELELGAPAALGSFHSGRTRPWRSIRVRGGIELGFTLSLGGPQFSIPGSLAGHGVLPLVLWYQQMDALNGRFHSCSTPSSDSNLLLLLQIVSTVESSKNYRVFARLNLSTMGPIHSVLDLY